MIFTYINELPELNDILNDILPEEEPLFFINEENVIDFIESAFELMNDYIDENPTAISEPDFYECFVDAITELFLIQFEEQINLNDLNLFKDELKQIVKEKKVSKGVIKLKKFASDGTTIPKIRQYIRKLMSQGFKPDIIFLDYIFKLYF